VIRAGTRTTRTELVKCFPEKRKIAETNCGNYGTRKKLTASLWGLSYTVGKQTNSLMSKKIHRSVVLRNQSKVRATILRELHLNIRYRRPKGCGGSNNDHNIFDGTSNRQYHSRGLLMRKTAANWIRRGKIKLNWKIKAKAKRLILH
jgi:hypothetical protein